MSIDWRKKCVMVIGGCGTVGSELVRQLIQQHQLGELVVLDNHEESLFRLESQWASSGVLRVFLADVRDAERMRLAMRGVDYVFSTAAYKHVLLCERSPYEAVQTNIIGVQNVITAAAANEVECVIHTSSDKAVNPTSVMGTTKLMGERLMTAAHSGQRRIQTIFASTRFGNVLGSSGSVIPLFKAQIAQGGPVTLTHPEMTRFIMSIGQSVLLVIESLSLAKGGEVFITKMPVINIRDLAEVLIEELAASFGHDPGQIPIKVVGPRPGEKLYEELLTEEETRRAVELDSYFVVLPAFSQLYRTIDYTYATQTRASVERPYISSQEQLLSKTEIAAVLRQNGLLEAVLRPGQDLSDQGKEKSEDASPYSGD